MTSKFQSRSAMTGDIFAWTPEKFARAVELHKQGLGIVRIGRTIGASKNAVYGKFVREGILVPVTKQKPGPKPRSVPKPEPVRAGQSTLPPLASLQGSKS